MLQQGQNVWGKFCTGLSSLYRWTSEVHHLQSPKTGQIDSQNIMYSVLLRPNYKTLYYVRSALLDIFPLKYFVVFGD